MLDFVSNAETLGKPGGADLHLGLATAPVLYAAEEYPELNELIERKFSAKGDADKVGSTFLVPVPNGPADPDP